MRLRCMRCGEWHEHEMGNPYFSGLCKRCAWRGLEILMAEEHPFPRYTRWQARYRKGDERHPTTLALNAAYASWSPTSDAPF